MTTGRRTLPTPSGRAVIQDGTQPVGHSRIAALPVRPTNSADIPRELIRAMAEAVGKNIAAYVEVMYPEAIKATSSTFKLSLRNSIYNDIMHVASLHTEAEIRGWLLDNEQHRKQWLAAYRKMRRKPSSPTK